MCYNISVYPLYSGWVGKPVSTQAFVEQGGEPLLLLLLIDQCVEGVGTHRCSKQRLFEVF